MFYKNNMSGKPENYLTFTDNQLKGLYENWSDQFENIAIFNSSEKEWEESHCRQPGLSQPSRRDRKNS